MTFKSDGPATDDQVEDEGDDLIRALFRDLEMSESAKRGADAPLGDSFTAFHHLPPASLERVGLDLAAYLGLGGDWSSSLGVVLKALEADGGNLTLKVWQLRCLVELERYAEAVALVNVVRWTDAERIHVNYLAGQSFESLGLKDQARQRFDAVRKADPAYRDVEQKLEKSR